MKVWSFPSVILDTYVSKNKFFHWMELDKIVDCQANIYSLSLVTCVSLSNTAVFAIVFLCNGIHIESCCLVNNRR